MSNRPASDVGSVLSLPVDGPETSADGTMSYRRRSAARMGGSGALGIAVGITAGFFATWQAAELIGWDTAAVVFLVGVWLSIARRDASDTERVALVEDPSVPASELAMISAAVACLGGVGMALTKAGQSSGDTKAVLIILGVFSVVSAWATVHTIYTLRYARLYYSGDRGGIDFNSEQPPNFLDFAYVAFTVGMTFQVSDTDLSSQVVRRAALLHALLSYLFGAVIIGMTINIVASLLH